SDGAARPPRRRDGREVNGPAMNGKGHRGGRRGAWSVVVRGERATRALAARLGGIVGPGAVLLLEGDLGAGKTTFVKGLAEGMGIDPDNGSSATFTLIHEYEGDVPLYHLDAYRLRAEGAFVAPGAGAAAAGAAGNRHRGGGRRSRRRRDPAHHLPAAGRRRRGLGGRAAAGVGGGGRPRCGCWVLTRPPTPAASRWWKTAALSPS